VRLSAGGAAVAMEKRAKPKVDAADVDALHITLGSARMRELAYLRV